MVAQWHVVAQQLPITDYGLRMTDDELQMTNDE
jgi:hypothetical protein